MHEPIEFHRPGDPGGDPANDTGERPGGGELGPNPPAEDVRPVELDLDKDRALTVRWSDGRLSVYPIAHLRKMSPSADQRALREEQASNPLTVLPSPKSGDSGPLRAIGAEMVGRYAVRIRFSDGHDTGIYSWAYLRKIDPDRPSCLG